MAKPFKNLMDRMSPERGEKIEEEAKAILLEMALQEWRQTRSRAQLVEVLDLNHATLSSHTSLTKEGTEKQADIRLSTLRRVLSAMGGKLKIMAQFPDGEVVLNLFDYVETQAA